MFADTGAGDFRHIYNEAGALGFLEKEGSGEADEDGGVDRCFDLRYYRGYVDSYVFFLGVHDPDFLHGEVYAGRGLSFREQGGLRTEIT